jgi:hypothetical protein
MEGKGDGPVGRFLKGPPADLRTLAQRNNGKYPADYVAAILRFENGQRSTRDIRHADLGAGVPGPEGQAEEQEGIGPTNSRFN